jgi:murein DD-endopeptidase MepM/ murein hydrolase activator NlpD
MAGESTKPPVPRRRKALRWIWRTAVFLLVFVLAAGALAYWIGTGPRDIEKYPKSQESPYRLPWSAGVVHRCVQSNRGVVSHRRWEEYAYDFAMPVGTEVRAARGGEVIKVVTDHDGHGRNMPNNLIAIRHEDGTLGYYLHLRKDGSRVKVGDVIRQGQVIGESGHVGKSLMPHLHFHVTDARRTSTLPISFADISADSGIPRMFKSYKSGNKSD